MTQNTVYFITGANRGIGLALAASLLQRPQTTVLVTHRPQSSPNALVNLPKHLTSKLHILPLSFSSVSDTSDTSVSNLAKTLKAAPYQLDKIDVIIANAGSGTSFFPSLSTSLQALRDDFEVNTLGPIALFQSLYPLLSKAEAGNEGGKFILISSSLGSIAAMEGGAPSLSYGVSKAGANYFVRKVHFECEGIVSLAVHPGWVKTANGQAFADAIGYEEPPMSLEESVSGVLNQVDRATRAGTSGTFVSYDGSVIPW